ncbi:hypothetical protein ACQEUU_04960 [Nonomuraea sp. CA-218870]|uniref:Resolvase/invertase-type recombinase catalytic domain-containing protein n=1 Tax=Nonomuraea corallina TaxID=2989783 RepID=A0ABT4SJS8_9ACTN|nr:hypothetical protein [Nonomuraea corallina]MDA0637245.1 hypothetical protein [Nonomuraea corallina]
MHSQGTKGLSRRKSRMLTRFQGLLAWADREICMEFDEFAHRRGWSVTRTGFGSRRYRDPRFDRIVPRVPEEVS